MTVLDAAALVTALILAGMLIVAGVAKLADQQGTREAVTGFGAPAWAAGGLAFVLPLAELAAAALLLPSSTRVGGAAATAGLLVIFSVAIAVNLLRGTTPDCHCFGQAHSAPVSWRTLIRNGAFIAAAAGVLAAGVTGESPSTIRWLSDLDATQAVALAVGIAFAALGAVGALAFLALTRSHGRVLLRLALLEERLAGAGIALDAEAEPQLGRAPGSAAPVFEATTVGGGSTSLDDLLAPGLPLLLLFTSPACGPCRILMPKVAFWQRLHTDRLTIAAVSGGGRVATLIEADEHGLERVLIDTNLDIYNAYGANGTPSAVLVSPDGTIGTYIVSGPEQVESLVADALSKSSDSDGLPIGAPVPELQLRGLSSEPVALVDPGGRETLLLFWNPECGYCRSMHERVLELERAATDSPLRLLIASAGDEESTRVEGFSSAVALDRDMLANWAFATFGTPTAVLLDAEGAVASAPAIGADAVLALAGARIAAGSLEAVGVNAG